MFTTIRIGNKVMESVFTAEEARNISRDAKASLEKRRRVRSIKVGRNEPCPCGSGKKFKRCCLR